MPSDERPLFEDAIDLPLWLEADRDTPLATRTDRDRAIARRVGAAGDLRRVRAWWSGLRPGDALGAAMLRGRRVVSAALLVTGVVAGSALAAAVLRYDGSAPVNVVSAFAILVGVQLLLLLLTLALLPSGRFGLGAVQRSLVTFNPAAIAAALYRRFATLPDAVERLFVWHAGRSSANRFAKWQLLYWSQLTAVAFNAGVLGTAFALVAVTDLAFGWSTTLDVEVRDVAAVAAAIATPWAAWLPQAVPSTELIDGSRFFRLEDVVTPARRAEAFTGWWPFLLASIVIYGLLPRFALWMLAAQRLRDATRHLLLDDARVTALLDRMGSPNVHLAAVTPEPTRDLPTQGVARLGKAHGGTAAAVIWADAIDARLAAEAVHQLLSAQLAEKPFTAGGAASLEDDRGTIEQLAALGPRQVVVFTRAYEPPLLDLLDFLTALRRRLADAVSIIVCPVPETGGGVAPAELDAWRRTLSTLRDSGLYVEVAP